MACSTPQNYHDVDLGRYNSNAKNTTNTKQTNKNMDGLSAAANVFGAIELTGSIVKVCGRYITEVKNARDDIFTLQRSVVGLEIILLSLVKNL